MGKAIDEAQVLLDEAYHPEGNVHYRSEHENEDGTVVIPGNYISGSQLVKSTAEDLAKKHIDMREGRHDDDVPSYYSFTGQLADLALEGTMYQECRIHWGIRNHEKLEYVDAGKPHIEHTGWRIQGHPDGVHVVDDEVCVLEHKAHLTGVNQRKINRAKRQGLLYLAMMSRQPGTTFEPAPWEDESGPFTWQPEYEPDGVVLGIAKSRPEPVNRSYEASQETLDSILDFYERKCEAIIESAENRDLSYAQDFDLQHDEFVDASPLDQDDEEEVEELLEELVEVKDRKKELDERRKSIKKALKRLLRDVGQESLDIGGYKVREITRNGGKKLDKDKLEEELGDQLEKFQKDGYTTSYIRVYD